MRSDEGNRDILIEIERCLAYLYPGAHEKIMLEYVEMGMDRRQLE